MAFMSSSMSGTIIFSTGGKFQLVSNFTELHASPQAASVSFPWYHQPHSQATPRFYLTAVEKNRVFWL